MLSAVTPAQQSPHEFGTDDLIADARIRIYLADSGSMVIETHRDGAWHNLGLFRDHDEAMMYLVEELLDGKALQVGWR